MNNMERHITKEEWILYFNHEIGFSDKLRLLRHVSECPSCRDIMEKGNDLRYALQMNQSGGYGAGEEAGEYRAVAGEGGAADSGNRAGYLSVMIRKLDNVLSFDEDSLESDGIANKYALNLSGSEFSDDEKLLSLVLREGELHTAFHDPGVSAAIAFITDGDFCQPEPLKNDGVYPLQVSSFCKVEISFSK